MDLSSEGHPLVVLVDCELVVGVVGVVEGKGKEKSVLVNVVAVMVNRKERTVWVKVLEERIDTRVALGRNREACGDDGGEGEDSRGGL